MEDIACHNLNGVFHICLMNEYAFFSFTHYLDRSPYDRDKINPFKNIYWLERKEGLKKERNISHYLYERERKDTLPKEHDF